ncbi:hypothetical protein [Thalassobellus citreus]|uniref:hypothetical protein n=1 Tax=Thalassobellus citreus TaxID=3367752 RepID=UPI0037BDE2F5
MKIDDILKLKTEEIIKIQKKKNITTWLLGIIVLFIIVIKVIDYSKTNEFDSMMILPVVFLPMVISDFMKLNKINAELKFRNTNGKSN